jgi:hypothetical protein
VEARLEVGEHGAPGVPRLGEPVEQDEGNCVRARGEAGKARRESGVLFCTVILACTAILGHSVILPQ